MKIVQLLPTMAFGDAVSNDAAAIDRMLSEMGYKTGLYAFNVDPRLPESVVSHWKKMKELRDDDLLIFVFVQLSDGKDQKRIPIKIQLPSQIFRL